MDHIKKLAGQTAVYGFGTVVPKLLNWSILTPLFTRIFLKGEYGVVTELYAYIILLMAVLTYGMETGFFRFSESSKDPKKVYSTSLISITVTTLIFLFAVFIFLDPIANIIQYGENKEYVIWFSLIVAIDVIISIPFAWLRKQNKPRKFAIIKLINVCVNIGLIFFFFKICPKIDYESNSWLGIVYKPEMGVGYVFIANLFASIITLIILIPVIFEARLVFSIGLIKKMLSYSWPLVIVGIAAAINEAGDKIMLKYLLPEQLNPIGQVGIYGASYKVAILMTLFVQMFRYAFEPFFFARAKLKDAKSVYADVMKYFVIAGLMIFLSVTMYIDVVKYFIGGDFYEGLYVVPIVLMANLMLGVYYNLSVWYKLTDKTRFAAILSIIGMVVTIVANVVLIPRIYYLGSAWGHLFCWITMVIFSYFLGKKYYPIKYDLKRILFYLCVAIGLYFIFDSINVENLWLRLLIRTIPIIIFLAVVEYREKVSKLIFNKL